MIFNIYSHYSRLKLWSKIINTPYFIKTCPTKLLKGNVVINGDKTTSIHLLWMTLFFSGKTRIKNINYCGDIIYSIDWLKENGLAEINKRKKYLDITSQIDNTNEEYIDLSNISNIRSNICMVSAMALKNKKVILKGARGCNFTNRKLDRHFALMKSFGLEFTREGSLYKIFRKFNKKSVDFDCSTNKYGSSVGVTCHALIASLAYPHRITLRNIALEVTPVILIKYIRKTTKRKIIINNKELTIEPIKSNHSNNKQNFVEIKIPPDLIEAFTYISCLISVGNGELTLSNIAIKEIPKTIYDAYRKIGVEISHYNNNKIKINIDKENITLYFHT